MGKYNFDEIIDRHGTSCNKWEYNVPEDVVPMWVADMDFAAAPEIREAMQKRLDHPVYGYTHHSKELKDSGDAMRKRPSAGTPLRPSTRLASSASL